MTYFNLLSGGEAFRFVGTDTKPETGEQYVVGHSLDNRRTAHAPPAKVQFTYVPMNRKMLG